MDQEIEQSVVWAEDLSQFEVGIMPQGDLGADFRTENDPLMNITDPETRKTIVERRGRVDVVWECEAVVHGREKDGGGGYYTMVVLKFRFEPNGLARRIKAVQAALQFSAIEKVNPRDGPEVVAIAPVGFFCVAPTTHNEARSQEGGGTAGFEAAGGKVEGTFKLTKSIEGRTWDAATVKGSVATRGRNWGPKNTASWSLFENQSKLHRKGVASSLTTAILVKRKDMKPFKASVSIDATAETWTAIECLFARNGKDDDVYFNPQRPSTTRLQIDGDNLGTFPIGSLAHVTSNTFLLGTMEVEHQK